MTRLSREPASVDVVGFTHGGEGVARLEGKAVFVPGGIPGETLVVRVVDDRKRWARAEIIEVVDASPDRVDPPCPYAPRFTGEAESRLARPPCGGCDLQHIAPDAQRRLKTRVVREQLERLGGVTDPPVAETTAVGPDLRYRAHARLTAGTDGRLGFHAQGTHDVVAIDDCRILASAPQRLREQVGDATGAAAVTVRAHTTGTAAAVLQPGPGGLDLPAGDFDLLLDQVPADGGGDGPGEGRPGLRPGGGSKESPGWGWGDSGGGRTRPVAVRGDGELSERVGAHVYGFDAATFFQVSPQGAAALVEQVTGAAGDVAGALVWDLYAGVGLLSVPLAAAGAEVVAVEGDTRAATWAARNAESAQVGLRVAAESVEVFLATAGSRAQAEPPDVVVLDPPRSGAGAGICRALAALLPATIVYVACDVAALARDTRTLTEAGYRLRAAVPLDLFPMTHHVEVVATFAR